MYVTIQEKPTSNYSPENGLSDINRENCFINQFCANLLNKNAPHIWDAITLPCTSQDKVTWYSREGGVRIALCSLHWTWQSIIKEIINIHNKYIVLNPHAQARLQPLCVVFLHTRASDKLSTTLQQQLLSMLCLSPSHWSHHVNNLGPALSVVYIVNGHLHLLCRSFWSEDCLSQKLWFFTILLLFLLSYYLPQVRKQA